MNYEKIYNQLVERRKVDILRDGYKEKHHIVPRSLGGSDEADNIVVLTAREHFIAHLLLTKIHRTGPSHYKMIRAVNMMLCSSMNHSRYTPPSRIYESLRILFSKAQSASQTSEGNSQYGTMWVFHDLFGPKKIDKTKLVEYLDQGWYKGKVLRKCKTAQVKEKPEKHPHLAEWYKIYSAVGFNAFVEKTGYKYSQPNLVKLFKRYVKDFVPQNGKKRGNGLIPE